jgi:hypothetical protein
VFDGELHTEKKKKPKTSQVLVDHAYNPSYLGSSPGKQFGRPYRKNIQYKKELYHRLDNFFFFKIPLMLVYYGFLKVCNFIFQALH